MTALMKTCEFMQEIDAAILEYCKVEVFAPKYTIAGGALRDTLLGQPVKDIDIVVSFKGDWGVSWPDEEYGPVGGFQATTDIPFTVRDLPVQLIYRDGDISIKGMMQHHSMGVSNVFWTEGVLVIDPLFLRDVSDKQHTVNRRRWGGIDACGDQGVSDRLQKYIDKITAKYPWPLR